MSQDQHSEHLPVPEPVPGQRLGDGAFAVLPADDSLSENKKHAQEPANIAQMAMKNVAKSAGNENVAGAELAAAEGLFERAWVRKTLWIALGTLVVLAYSLALVLAAKAYLMPRVLSRIAVVDVNEALDARRGQFLQMMNKPGITDTDRERAYDFIKRSSTEVSATVKQITAECQCLLLVKAAVFNPEVVTDLTPLLRERVGLGQAAPAELGMGAAGAAMGAMQGAAVTKPGAKP